MLNSQEIEIISWRMATELQRRSPSDLSIAEMHPGGGMYDCLALEKINGESIAFINREGSFQSWGHNGGRIEQEDLWISENTHGPQLLAVVDKMCELIGLRVPKQLPPTTPESLVYRFIAAFLTHAYGGLSHWECRGGFKDTSGYDGGWRESWFEPFPTAQQPLASARRNGYLYSFWILLENEKPMLCLETCGIAHRRDGTKVDLMPIYKAQRRIWPVIAKVALEILP
jgi:hypothetical protein